MPCRFLRLRNACPSSFIFGQFVGDARIMIVNKWRMIVAVLYATFAIAKRKPEKLQTLFFLFFGLSFRTCKSCVYKDDHPSFNSSLRNSHIWFSYHSKFQPCLCWKVSPWGVQAKTPWWQQHTAMPRGRRIAYKLHVITENITKHDDSLSKEGGKPKTGLNCLHNFNNEKRHYKYKASYQIGTKSTTSEARKRKEQRRWKGEKRKLTACENRRKRACPVFHTLSPPCKGLWAGHIWYSPTGNSWLWNSTFARPLQSKLFRQGSPVWDFCTWGWMNLQLS